MILPDLKGYVATLTGEYNQKMLNWDLQFHGRKKEERKEIMNGKQFVTFRLENWRREHTPKCL